MKALLTCLLLIGGFCVSLVGAMFLAYAYQEIFGSHPDVLGFEDISELSSSQEWFQKVLFVATLIAGLYVTYRFARRLKDGIEMPGSSDSR